MLVAQLNGQRIEADDAERGPAYRCPNCRDAVVLKKGRIVAHHFAHKPPHDCTWGKGETDEHRQAKKLFRDEFVRRGLRAEVEYEVSSLPDDRRADVVVWSPQGQAYALELQHSPVDYDNLEHRTRSYMHAGLRAIWIPFLRPKLSQDAKKLGPEEDGDYRIRRYPARPFERWVHGFYFGQFWIYDPSRKALWKAKLAKHKMFVESFKWYDSEGAEQRVGGYWKISKKWRELTLWGPYGLNQVRIESLNRKATEIGKHRYPGGTVGRFVA